MSLLAHFQTATVVRCLSCAQYSWVSLADSDNSASKRYFFSFSLAKLRSYFYLLKDKIFFSYLHKLAGLKTPCKGTTIAMVGGTRSRFLQNWQFFSGFTCPAVVFLYFYSYVFMIHVFLTNFLPIKCTVFGLQKPRVCFFGCSYEAGAKYFVN